MTGFQGAPGLHHPQGPLQHPELLGGRTSSSPSPFCVWSMWFLVAFNVGSQWILSSWMDVFLPSPPPPPARKYVLKYLNGLWVHPLPGGSTCLPASLLGCQSGQPAALLLSQRPGGSLAGPGVSARLPVPLQIGRLELGQGCRGQGGSHVPFPTVS